MKIALSIILSSLFCTAVLGQNSVKDYGYNYHKISFKSDTVEFISKSKKGEENLKKPIIIYAQGSGAKPLVKIDGKKYFSPFSFDENIFVDEYHLICIGKPEIPILMNRSELSISGELKDSVTKFPPVEYTKRANLTYYTERNNAVLKYLLKQEWVDTNRIVVAGHSEGATIAVKMAVTNKKVTHLIYSGGTPYYSRILSIITQDRKIESEKDSWIKKDFAYWEDANDDPFDVSRDHGNNSYKGTISFSENLNDDFKRLDIPVLVSYGTKDSACPFNDLLRVEMIQENKRNIEFKDYINRNHNYFGFTKNYKVNYEDFGWDLVGNDWLNWLNKK